MKYLHSYSIFESITSTTGNKVVTYLETGQGSKYLMTNKGETKRWKSVHTMTGGKDTGLKSWHQKSFFIEPKFESLANSILHLTNKGMILSNIGIHVENNKVKIYILKDDKWVIGNMLDAYPKFGKDSPLEFECVDKPTIGYNIVEYSLDDNKFSLKKYHCGSKVTKITPIDNLDKKDLAFFIVPSKMDTVTPVSTDVKDNAEYYESSYGTIAANYLFTGGNGVILSTDYLLQALTAVFPYSGKAIDNIRNKYANKLSQILKDDINTDTYNSVMQEIRNAINNTYGNEKANKIFEKILKNATGFTLSREGNQVSSDAEKLNAELAALKK